MKNKLTIQQKDDIMLCTIQQIFSNVMTLRFTSGEYVIKSGTVLYSKILKLYWCTNGLKIYKR
mgnify:CR=1 FL=1